MGHFKRYSPAEDAILIANADLPLDRQAKLLTALGLSVRTPHSVKARRAQLGLCVDKNKWTDAETERLRVYWVEQRLTAAEIRALCPEHSRSAINGKVRRMQWPRSERQTASAGRPLTTPKPPAPTLAARQFQHGDGCEIGQTPKPVKVEAIVGPTPDSLNVPMWDPRFKAGCCKYGTKEVDGIQLFCCAPAEPGAPYCEPHRRACRQEGSLHQRALAETKSAQTVSRTPEPKADRDLPVDEAVDPDRQRRRFRSVRFAAFGEEAA